MLIHLICQLTQYFAHILRTARNPLVWLELYSGGTPIVL